MSAVKLVSSDGSKLGKIMHANRRLRDTALRFPTILFIKQAAYLAAPLSILFNNSVSVGEIPDDWRKAIIIPTAKGGVASGVSNYRPIALTSSL